MSKEKQNCPDKDRRDWEMPLDVDKIIRQYRDTLKAQHRETTKDEEETLSYMHDHPERVRPAMRLMAGKKLPNGMRTPGPNRCRTCKHQFLEVKFSSPEWTWKMLCGRATFKLVCPYCGKVRKTRHILMN